MVEFEGLAHPIRDWAFVLVPGVLRTAQYTRAVLRAYGPLLDEEAVEGRGAARQARARIPKNPGKPRYGAVLDEMVVRRPVGGPTVLAEPNSLGDRIRAGIRTLPVLAEAVVRVGRGRHAEVNKLRPAIGRSPFKAVELGHRGVKADVKSLAPAQPAAGAGLAEGLDDLQEAGRWRGFIWRTGHRMTC